MDSSSDVKPLPSGDGTFVLPQVSADVPMVLGGESVAYQSLAKFSLAMEKLGLPLPGGLFTNPAKILQEQLHTWLESQIGPSARTTLNGAPHISATVEGLVFSMGSSSDLELIKLKPLVEELESQHAGLGWYVVQVIEHASVRGTGLYTPGSMAYHAQSYFHGAESDQEFVTEMRAMEGMDEPTDEEMPELLEQARNDYGYLPSSLLASVDGHAHLLGWQPAEGAPRIVRFKRPEVVALLKRIELPQHLLQCVKDAVALDALLHKHKTVYAPGRLHYEEDMEPIGAACFVAWDNPDLLFELAGHFEEDAYNCGTAAENLALLEVKASASPTEFERFARLVRDYFLQWNALGNVLAHFAQHIGNNHEINRGVP
jgi:PRTRC genetic system protein F